MSPRNEVEILTARGHSMLLIILTVLLACCWLIGGDPRIETAMFISGLIAVVTWLSYCQSKTTAEVALLLDKSNN